MSARFTDVNAVLLAIDSATVSGYCISAPEQDHEVDCPVVEAQLAAAEAEADEEDEGEPTCSECGAPLEEDEPEEDDAPFEVCSCRVTGYELIEAGTVRTQQERQDVVERAVEVAADLGVPLIVVREDWTHHGMSDVAYKSLLVNWGKWEAELEHIGLPASCIIAVLTNTWHGAIFGKAGVPREQRKARAQAYVQHAMKLPPYGEDISEALCIRAWGQRAEEVHVAVQELLREAA